MTTQAEADALREFAARLEFLQTDQGSGELALVRGTLCVYRVSSAARSWLERPAGPPPARLAREFAWLEALGLVVRGVPLRSGRPTTLVLSLIHACNLACDYCNVAQGTYNDPGQQMPSEVARRAVDLLATHADSARLAIDFFGGEPLLNLGTLRETICYAREAWGDVRWAFRVTTNGLLVTDELARYFEAEAVHVIVSIDGPAEQHDRYRRGHDGSGSYAAARAAVDRLAAHGVRLALHAAVDDDVDMKATREHLVELAPPSASFRVTRIERSGCADADAEGAPSYTLPERFGALTLSLDEASLAAKLLRGPFEQERAQCNGARQRFVSARGEVYPCRAWASRGREHAIGSVYGSADDWLAEATTLEGCGRDAMCSHGCSFAGRPGGRPDPAATCQRAFEALERGARRVIGLSLEEAEAMFAYASSAAALEDLRRAWKLRSFIAAKHEHMTPVFLFPQPAEPLPRAQAPAVRVLPVASPARE